MTATKNNASRKVFSAVHCSPLCNRLFILDDRFENATLMLFSRFSYHHHHHHHTNIMSYSEHLREHWTRSKNELMISVTLSYTINCFLRWSIVSSIFVFDMLSCITEARCSSRLYCGVMSFFAYVSASVSKFRSVRNFRAGFWSEKKPAFPAEWAGHSCRNAPFSLRLFESE